MPSGSSGSRPDCVVIGGGIMGLTVAWRLARAGVRTIVIERTAPGAEASSAAGGILAAQEEARGPSPLLDLCLASRARWAEMARELVEATGVDIGYRIDGILSVAFTEEEERALEARYLWMRRAGLDLAWLGAADARERAPVLSPAVRGAFLFARDGQLEPRATVKALAAAVAHAGVELVAGVSVRRVRVEQGAVRGVDLDDRSIDCERVVLAAGSWSSLVEGTGLPPVLVRPIRGQMVRVHAGPTALSGTLVSPRGAYAVARADGSVLMGSTVEEVGFRKEVTAGGLRSILDAGLELAPGLADAAVTETWAGFRPGTPDGLPILGGCGVRGLVLAMGHYRYGILLAAITGDIVRELVTAERTAWPLAPFGVERFAREAA